MDKVTSYVNNIKKTPIEVVQGVRKVDYGYLRNTYWYGQQIAKRSDNDGVRRVEQHMRKFS